MKYQDIEPVILKRITKTNQSNRKIEQAIRHNAICRDGQAKKSAWWMPWHWKPKKDVISCEKRRGEANILRSADIRMGKPIHENHGYV